MTQEQQFNRLIDSELHCLQALLATLNQEFEILTNGDVSALEQATKEKNDALAKQAAATLARQNFVINSKHEDSDQGLQQLISTFQDQQAVSASIDQLRSLAEQCQSINRVNGRLITQKQQHARNALDILRQADSKPSIYSGQGDTVTQSESRSLGKA